MVAAVAVGATAAATQGLQQAQAAQGDNLREFGIDKVAAYSGLGGDNANQVVPVSNVTPAAQSSLTDDLNGMAKGQRIAEQRVAEAKAAADRLAAQQRAAKAEADRRAAAERQRLEALKNGGTAVLPAVGELTSGFGSRWGMQHNGIDIANSIGTPILATMSGEVISSGPASGFGLWVRLQHPDGTISVYGHINESLVSVGEHVDAGQQIATMGNRGEATGPHLHFEIWQDGQTKIDPLPWLREHGVNI